MVKNERLLLRRFPCRLRATIIYFSSQSVKYPQVGILFHLNEQSRCLILGAYLECLAPDCSGTLVWKFYTLFSVMHNNRKHCLHTIDSKHAKFMSFLQLTHLGSYKLITVISPVLLAISKESGTKFFFKSLFESWISSKGCRYFITRSGK